MWVFLLTEILFFGGLFVVYMIYRIWYFEAFAEASNRLNIFYGALNTAVLIFSSLTMAMAVRGAQTNKRKATVNWLILTMLLGSVFLGVKVIEYKDKFEKHEVPGANFNWDYEHQQELKAEGGAAAEHSTAPAETAGGEHHKTVMTTEQLQRTTQLYFSLYFTMTGLHEGIEDRFFGASFGNSQRREMILCRDANQRYAKKRNDYVKPHNRDITRFSSR